MKSLKDWIKSLNIIDPKDIKVIAVSGDTIDIKIGNKVYQNVKPKRPFPYTHPEYIILTVGDEEEIGIIKDYRKLDKRSRKLLERALEVLYFMPKIKKILSIRTTGWLYEWNVETDKGSTSFNTYSRCIRFITDKKVVIYDIHGNVYCIEDIHKLDTRSLMLLSFMM
mgnify:CR=1 FL=1